MIPHQDRRQQGDSDDSPLRDGAHYPNFRFPRPRPPRDDEPVDEDEGAGCGSTAATT